MNDRMNNRKTGTFGEVIAVKYLQENNYSILKTNFRVGRLGEIDIIARDAEYICFIEIKTRRSESFGTPAESVTSAKQRKIHQIASIYLSNTNKIDKPVRFDVIEIILSRPNDKVSKIDHIKNAF